MLCLCFSRVSHMCSSMCSISLHHARCTTCHLLWMRGAPPQTLNLLSTCPPISLCRRRFPMPRIAAKHLGDISCSKKIHFLRIASPRGINCLTLEGSPYHCSSSHKNPLSLSLYGKLRIHPGTSWPIPKRSRKIA